MPIFNIMLYYITMPYNKSKKLRKGTSKKGGSYASNNFTRFIGRKFKNSRKNNKVFNEFKQKRDKGCNKYMEFTEYDTETGTPIIWRHPQLFNSITGRPCSSKDRVYADAYDENYNLMINMPPKEVYNPITGFKYNVLSGKIRISPKLATNPVTYNNLKLNNNSNIDTIKNEVYNVLNKYNIDIENINNSKFDKRLEEYIKKNKMINIQ